MSAKPCRDSVLSDLQLRERALRSRQPSDLPELARFAAQEKARKSDAGTHSKSVNPSSDKEIQDRAPQMTAAISRKDNPCNDMQEVQERRDGQKSKKKSEKFDAASTLMRWCKFNFVGAIGVAVQFAALILLKSALHMNYLLATAIAVEAAVVHNFVWHEQFTWADRLQTSTSGAKALIQRSGVIAALKALRHPKASLLANSEARNSANSRARNLPRAFFAALKRCATQNLFVLITECAPDWRGLRHPSVARFLRFNFSNGAVSILGNLALMKVLVGQGHMNYLAANAIAIALCSLANFLVSNEWVFANDGSLGS